MPEFAGELSERVFAAIDVYGQADNQVFRLPFLNQRGDAGEFFIVAVAGNRGDGVGDADAAIALRCTDACFAARRWRVRQNQA